MPTQWVHDSANPYSTAAAQGSVDAWLPPGVTGWMVRTRGCHLLCVVFALALPSMPSILDIIPLHSNACVGGALMAQVVSDSTAAVPCNEALHAGRPMHVSRSSSSHCQLHLAAFLSHQHHVMCESPHRRACRAACTGHMCPLCLHCVRHITTEATPSAVCLWQTYPLQCRLSAVQLTYS
jgi:hypothetical protein